MSYKFQKGKDNKYILKKVAKKTKPLSQDELAMAAMEEKMEKMESGKEADHKKSDCKK